jgi:hypothetical protein
MPRDFGSHRPQLVSRTLSGDHYIECSMCKWQWDIVQTGVELELRRSYRIGFAGDCQDFGDSEGGQE